MENPYESYIQQLLENQERILNLLDEIRINTGRNLLKSRLLSYRAVHLLRQAPAGATYCHRGSQLPNQQ